MHLKQKNLQQLFGIIILLLNVSCASAQSISDIYDHFRDYENQTVTLTGVVNLVMDVTTSSGSRRISAYLQDESGRGLYLSQSGPAYLFPGIQRQNRISIQGFISYYASVIQMGGFDNSGIEVLATGVPLPQPLDVGTGDTVLQQTIIQTSESELFANGTWCRVTGIVDSVEGHIGGGTNLYINDGTGELSIRIWDFSHVDSVFLNNRYYRLWELQGVACTISGVAAVYNRRFMLLVGYAEDFTAPLALSHARSMLPEVNQLGQNFPNPFNASTTITYELCETGHISLRVYDLLGRTVAILREGIIAAGTHHETFDGSRLTTGIYFSKLQTGTFSQCRKLLLIK